MGDNHSTHTEDTLGATDLSRDGISHLKMQNTPSVKPHKHTLLLMMSDRSQKLQNVSDTVIVFAQIVITEIAVMITFAIYCICIVS